MISLNRFFFLVGVKKHPLLGFQKWRPTSPPKELSLDKICWIFKNQNSSRSKLVCQKKIAPRQKMRSPMSTQILTLTLRPFIPEQGPLFRKNLQSYEDYNICFRCLHSDVTPATDRQNPGTWYPQSPVSHTLVSPVEMYFFLVFFFPGSKS